MTDFDGSYEPWTQRPSGLIVPSRLDPSGTSGPTRGQARGPRWESVAPWWYAPTGRPDVVEQRILEQAHRVLPDKGAVTAWADLRWMGVTYFDGTGMDGDALLPVPLITDHHLAHHPGSTVTQTQMGANERRTVGGIPVASIQRALFDELVRRNPRLWKGVEAIDMVFAAQLISLLLFEQYVVHRQAWTGVPFVRQVLKYASEHSRSPRETWLRLIWIILCGFPPPLCNRAVYDLEGRFIGMPDLLDVEAGLAVEYQGGTHDVPEQQVKDDEREERLRDHGLEYLEIDRTHSVARASHLLADAREAAKFLPPESRAWTIDVPPGVTPPETLDDLLARLGLVADRLMF